MKQFFDTLAVFVGNLLELSPKSWLECKKQAEKMREALKVWTATPSITDKDGKPVESVAPESPYAYLGRTTLMALGFVGLVWVISQIVMGFIYALPVMLGLAAIALLVSLFPPKKAEPVAA